MLDTPQTSWRPDDGAIAALVEGRHGDPFALLGMHEAGRSALSVRVFWPGAASVEVLDAKTGRPEGALEMLHPAGFFAGQLERRERFPYRLRLSAGDVTWEAEDPYRFPPLLGEMDVYLIAEGSHRRIYERFGAHPRTVEGVDGVAFALWAPNAQRVSVVGDFNQWDGRRHPMRKRIETGAWELFVPGAPIGSIYKYEIIGAHGELLPLKTDPVGFEQEPPPATGSRIVGLPRHHWGDGDWMSRRQQRQDLAAPISTYEVHLGSWRRKDGNAFLTYDDFADELFGELVVAEEAVAVLAAPGAEMHLVDGDRRLQAMPRLALRHPVRVAPFVAREADDL